MLHCNIWNIKNEEYGGFGDAFNQKYSLKIREADYHRAYRWHILQSDVKPRVKYWTYITPKEELPKTWEIT